jgi:hypothetical protein
LNPQAIQCLDADHACNIYLNPAQSSLQIVLKQSNFSTLYKASIYNLSGQLLLEKDLSKGQQIIDINHLSNGLCIVKISSPDKVYQYKFVKEEKLF